MPVKSFRAAAERIVRQESAAPTDVLRLLGSAVQPARAIAGEQDEWDVRLGALAALGEYDALGIVASKPLRLEHWHNISEPRALQEAVAEARDEATRRGAAVQLRASMTLADGRLSSEIMVAPLATVEGIEGVVLALRAGRGFSATDAITAASVGTVLALEVNRGAGAREDVRTVRQSLALYELARIGLGREELGERVPIMVEVVAKSLGHDLAQLWLLRGGGSLRLRAAHPRESLVLEIARPRDHAGLARALDGESSRVKGPSLRSWIRRTTRELIIAPLPDGAGVSGLLILGRWSEEYADDDLKLATQCAEFFAQVVAADALARRGRAAVAREDAQVDETEDSLTGS
ncbi:MAG: hypothetical protein QOH08_635 [Chloroflexota bacterium]|nr:hypothetical protein [Chloroflexota bacterium]